MVYEWGEGVLWNCCDIFTCFDGIQVGTWGKRHACIADFQYYSVCLQEYIDLKEYKQYQQNKQKSSRKKQKKRKCKLVYITYTIISQEFA